jgi:hypothetical protein
MVPILPCRSIDEQAEFYTALGFAESFRQTRPNPYLEVRHGGIVLQFYGLRAHQPGSRFDTCFALLEAGRAGHGRRQGPMELDSARHLVAGYPSAQWVHKARAA